MNTIRLQAVIGTLDFDGCVAKFGTVMVLTGWVANEIQFPPSNRQKIHHATYFIEGLIRDN